VYERFTSGSGISFWNFSEGFNSLIINCTFSKNKANQGWVVRGETGVCTLINCIVWGNLGYHPTIDPSATVSFSNIQGGFDGEGNIDNDPIFIEDSLFYQLAKGSPCIDTGSNEGTLADIQNIKRPQGHGYDMGASEHHEFVILSSHNIQECNNNNTLELSWIFPKNNIVGYSFLLDHSSQTIPEPDVNLSYTSTVKDF
jgi:hypothetical protein